MPSLYVMETGSRIEIEYQRVLVTLEDEILLRLPIHKVNQIILIGKVGLTTPALHQLLEKNIPVIFLSSGGKYLGQISPAFSGNLPLRQQQFRRNDDPDFALSFAQRIVTGKIHNQFIQTRRWARYQLDISPDLVEELRIHEEKARSADKLTSLLGIEGSAARAYFQAMQKVIPPQWGFTDRNRRPPKDPVNALLGLGYTLLTYTICAALQIVGLDPYLGYYHTEGYGRPSLALDLVEEFRVPIVDTLVTGLINRGQINQEDFCQVNGNTDFWMKPLARREFFKAFGQRIASIVKTPEIKRGISYQKHFEVQARKVANLILGKIDEYDPFEMR